MIEGVREMGKQVKLMSRPEISVHIFINFFYFCFFIQHIFELVLNIPNWCEDVTHYSFALLQ